MALEREAKTTPPAHVGGNVNSSKEEMIGCNRVKPSVAAKLVMCLKCGHDWTYKGKSDKRIHCPKCGSSQVDYNRERFGKWRP